MDGETLSIGTMYISNNKVRLTKIVTAVDSDTYEYSLGGRFIGSARDVFDEHGILIPLIAPSSFKYEGESSESAKDRALKKEVEDGSLFSIAPVTSVLHYRYSDTFILPITELETSGRYISKQNPDFVCKLGEVYANRFGRLSMLTSVYHGDDDLSDRLVSDTGTAFYRDGCYPIKNNLNRMPSMFDLVYQRL
jgi:hypothetical protein